MGTPAAIAVVVLVVLCLAYLLPQLIHEKQDAVEAKLAERETWGARIITRVPRAAWPGRSTTALVQSTVIEESAAVSSPSPVQRPASGRRPASAPHRPATAGAAARPAQAMRPHLPKPVVQARARAARFRVAAVIALLVLAVIGWALTATMSLLWVVPLVPTAAAVAVLAAGRHTVLKNARTDAVTYGLAVPDAGNPAQRKAAPSARVARDSKVAAAARKTAPQAAAARAAKAAPAESVESAQSTEQAAPARSGRLARRMAAVAKAVRPDAGQPTAAQATAKAAGRPGMPPVARAVREEAAKGSGRMNATRRAALTARRRAQAEAALPQPLPIRDLFDQDQAEQTGVTPPVPAVDEGAPTEVMSVIGRVAAAAAGEAPDERDLGAAWDLELALSHEAEAGADSPLLSDQAGPAGVAAARNGRTGLVGDVERAAAAEVARAERDLEIAAREEAGMQAEAASGRAWTPTPMPAPVYMLEADAKRGEPKALTEDDYEAARAAAERLTATDPAETGRIPLPPRVIFGSSAIDVTQALAKRRAASAN